MIVLAALALAVAGACGGGSKAHTATRAAAPVLPSPNEPLPRDPAALATRLTQVGGDLNASIGEWLRNGDPSRGGPPEWTDNVLAGLRWRTYVR